MFVSMFKFQSSPRPIVKFFWIKIPGKHIVTVISIDPLFKKGPCLIHNGKLEILI